MPKTTYISKEDADSLEEFLLLHDGQTSGECETEGCSGRTEIDMSDETGAWQLFAYCPACQERMEETEEA